MQTASTSKDACFVVGVVRYVPLAKKYIDCHQVCVINKKWRFEFEYFTKSKCAGEFFPNKCNKLKLFYMW